MTTTAEVALYLTILAEIAAAEAEEQEIEVMLSMMDAEQGAAEQA